MNSKLSRFDTSQLGHIIQVISISWCRQISGKANQRGVVLQTPRTCPSITAGGQNKVSRKANTKAQETKHANSRSKTCLEFWVPKSIPLSRVMYSWVTVGTAYTKSLGLRGLAGKFPSFRMPLTETSLLSARTARLRRYLRLNLLLHAVSLQQTNKYKQLPWPSK